MAITTPEVVKANIVLVGVRLLTTPEEVESFKYFIGTDVQLAAVGMGVNVQTGVAEPGVTLMLNRDRITLELSPGRSVISRDYPSYEDLPRLAEVAAQAINDTPIGDQTLRAFGFNLEFFFGQQSAPTAFEYLSNRLFAVRAIGNADWEFVGGAGRLIFLDGDRRWTVSLEPRFNDEREPRVFLTANLHNTGDTPPGEDTMRGSLEEIWEETHRFVNRLDESA